MHRPLITLLFILSIFLLRQDICVAEKLHQQALFAEPVMLQTEFASLSFDKGVPVLKNKSKQVLLAEQRQLAAQSEWHIQQQNQGQLHIVYPAQGISKPLYYHSLGKGMLHIQGQDIHKVKHGFTGPDSGYFDLDQDGDADIYYQGVSETYLEAPGLELIDVMTPEGYQGAPSYEFNLFATDVRVVSPDQGFPTAKFSKPKEIHLSKYADASYEVIRLVPFGFPNKPILQADPQSLFLRSTGRLSAGVPLSQLLGGEVS